MHAIETRLFDTGQGSEDSAKERYVNLNVWQSRLAPDEAPVAGRLDRLEDNYAQLLSLLSNKTTGSNVDTESPQTNISIDANIPTPPTSTQADVHPMDGLGTDPEFFELEASIPIYRRMSAEHFPYVMLPEDCSASWLFHHRPLLALAIGVVTTGRDQSRHSHLREHFLNELSSRYFVKYERSLDLVQAVLVYFAW